MKKLYLPPLLNEIAEVAGIDAALVLAQKYGGSRVTIPARIDADHWLITAVGRDAAYKICDHFRIGIHGIGISLDIPTDPHSPLNSLQQSNRGKIDEMLRDGINPEQIARTLGVHRTTVFRRKALMRDAKQQRFGKSLTSKGKS